MEKPNLFELAKEIRKEGEPWQDAVKRAAQAIKDKEKRQPPKGNSFSPFRNSR